jgi:hypothetical protein
MTTDGGHEQLELGRSDVIESCGNSSVKFF